MKKIIKKTKKSFKLIDFKVYNNYKTEDYNESTGETETEYSFRIQMFAMDKMGNNVSIFVDDFRPFFFIKVSDKIKVNKERGKKEIIDFIKNSLNVRYNIVDEVLLVNRRKLYGFDNKKNHKFPSVIAFTY